MDSLHRQQLYQLSAHAQYAWGWGCQEAIGEKGRRGSKGRDEGPKAAVVHSMTSAGLLPVQYLGGDRDSPSL